MFYTNDEIYHRLLEEKVLKVERGVIENRDERDCLVKTKKNNLYYLDYSFFDKYNIDALFEPAGYGEKFLDWDVWKCKKSEWKKRREDRLKEAQ